MGKMHPVDSNADKELQLYSHWIHRYLHPLVESQTSWSSEVLGDRLEKRTELVSSPMNFSRFRMWYAAWWHSLADGTNVSQKQVSCIFYAEGRGRMFIQNGGTIYQTKQCHNSGDCDLNLHCHENLKLQVCAGCYEFTTDRSIHIHLWAYKPVHICVLVRNLWDTGKPGSNEHTDKVLKDVCQSYKISGWYVYACIKKRSWFLTQWCRLWKVISTGKQAVWITVILTHWGRGF